MHHSIALNSALGFSVFGVEIEFTTFCTVLIKQFLGNHIEIAESLGEARHHIDIPVGRTISDHNTSKRNCSQLVTEGSLQVVLVDLPSKVGHVNSTVGFTTDVNRVRVELREFSQPVLEGGKGVA